MPATATLVGNVSWVQLEDPPHDWVLSFPGDTESWLDYGDVDWMRGAFTVFFSWKPHGDLVGFRNGLNLNDGYKDAKFSLLVKSTNREAPTFASKEVHFAFVAGGQSSIETEGEEVIDNSSNFDLQVGGTSKLGHPGFIRRFCPELPLTAAWQTAAVVCGKGKTPPNGMKVFKNGARIDNTSSGSNTGKTALLSRDVNTAHLLVGCGLYGHTGFKGYIERIMFWRKALSDNAVRQLHEDQSAQW